MNLNQQLEQLLHWLQSRAEYRGELNSVEKDPKDMVYDSALLFRYL